MDRQRREEEVKKRSSKRAPDADQPGLNRVMCPQTGGQPAGGSLNSMKGKPDKQEKEGQEGLALKTAGAEGEITAGFLLKRSAKTNGWSRRWFVLNGKTGKLVYTKKQEEQHPCGVIALEECNLEEIPKEDEPPSKSPGKDSSLVFKITSRVPYKTILKAHSAVVLKAESMADKSKWLTKLRNVISSIGGQVKAADSGPPMRQSLSDGSLAVVLCQVQKAKEDMLPKLYSSISGQSTSRIEELLMEDQNVKCPRECLQKQSSLISELTGQLDIDDISAGTTRSYPNGAAGKRRKLENQYLHQSRTSLLGLKFSGGILMGADSREFDGIDGHVVGVDDVMKHSYIRERVYMCCSGDLTTCEGVFQDVSNEPNLPEGVWAISDRVEHYVSQYGTENTFIVGGCENRATDGVEICSIHRNRATKLYHVEKTGFAFGGSGAKHFKDDPPANPLLDLDSAKKYMKQALAKARKFDWCTDGKLNTVAVLSDGSCTFASCDPAGPRPSQPYGDWVENHRFPRGQPNQAQP